jgi:hypothetical protein
VFQFLKIGVTHLVRPFDKSADPEYVILFVDVLYALYGVLSESAEII